jgi:Flp pilus assembly protein TadG
MHRTKFRRGQQPDRQRGSRRNREKGVIITLVAVCMLGFVGAMAAFSIDVVTLYTARSEAQLAADSAALAGARVLANSGMTSENSATVGTNAAPLAIAVATQVAANNPVAGRNLVSGGACPGQEICVTVNTGALDFVANPQVTVTVQRTDLPTFFARIWGRTAFTVKASATAEAYNPSSLQGTAAGPGLPIAPTCVKPWLLPNMSPNTAPTNPKIFDAASGAILDTNLLGWATPTGGGTGRMKTECSTANGGTADCTPVGNNAPTPWQYYPGTTDATTGSFPAPGSTSCTGCSGFTPYELSIAGCVQTPISCNATVNIDTTAYATRDAETRVAVNSLTHSTAAVNSGDSVDTTAGTLPPTGTEPFQFLAGTDNPIVKSGALASGTDVMLSDSLVTVPVIDTSAPNWPGTYPNNVQIIGFVQLFLNPTGAEVPPSNHIHTQVINLVGCGDGTGSVPAAPPAILGNGASPVAVRLISPAS